MENNLGFVLEFWQIKVSVVLLFNMRNIQFTCGEKKKRKKKERAIKDRVIDTTAIFWIIIKNVEMHQAFKTGMTWIAWQTEIQNDVVRTSYWNGCNQNNEEQPNKTKQTQSKTKV